MSRPAFNHLPAIGFIAVCIGCNQTATVDSPLQETRWQLTELNDANAAGKQLDKAGIVFADDGTKVSGSDGCNRFFGEYTQQEESLSFSLMGSTRMACEEAVTFDAPFYDALSRTTNYRIRGDILRLYNGEGTTMRFKARPPADSSAEKGQAADVAGHE